MSVYVRPTSGFDKPEPAGAENRFQLNCEALEAECASVFSRTGRVHIPAALEPDAAMELHEALRDHAGYALVVNSGEKTYDFSPIARAEGGPDFERKLAEIAATNGRDGFQYIFESVRLSEDGEDYPGEHALFHDITRFLNSPRFLQFARHVTGDDEIVLTDAQATRYRPGHFLTAHDDRNDVKSRRAAFVLNLTPSWKADWGGLLNFIDADGHIAEGYTPAWNALNLFRVPQLHHVSYVNPMAGADRLSITGWLRTR